MTTTKSYLNPSLNFERGQDTAFGNGLAHFQHSFSESHLFTDEKLAELIESYPRHYYLISTMSGSEDRDQWQYGDLNGVSGDFVLKAIRNGRLWLCLRRLDLVAPEYEELIDAVFSEAEARNPELHTSRRTSSLLISSPGARVLYHSDIPMVALWHVRGRKRIWLYDAENPAHLPDDVLEGVMLRETEEEIPYDPTWDTDATMIDLEPGWALSWPQNAPHRVDNLDGLNVSITTDFYTPKAQRKYGVYYANGFIRRRLGLCPRSTRTSGFGAFAKCVTALTIKRTGLQCVPEREMLQSFLLDRNEPGALIDLGPHRLQPILQA